MLVSTAAESSDGGKKWPECVRDSREGSVQGEVERSLLMTVSHLTIKKMNCISLQKKQAMKRMVDLRCDLSWEMCCMSSWDHLMVALLLLLVNDRGQLEISHCQQATTRRNLEPVAIGLPADLGG